ncbi:MAG: SDR family NAD(P)-dependent oxidoreductase [Cytophagales bacterium]|nr:SDR family NAD(P)-dependent oxidoreductase [Cytophagales bacterium]
MSLNPKIKDWRGKVVWIVGASTGIGQSLAHILHRQGAVVIVSARSQDKLSAFVAQHASSIALPLDVTDAAQVTQTAEQILSMHSRMDMLFYCAGYYTAQTASNVKDPFSLAAMQQHMTLNFSGALTVLHACFPKVGHIALVASVAGYQALPNALAYAPSKAAMQRLAEGLYIHLHGSGVGITLINPGFVQTPMTAQNNFHMPALISAETAAKAILKGLAAGRFEIHFPRRFTLWVKLLSLLPYRMYFAVCRAIMPRPTSQAPTTL